MMNPQTPPAHDDSLPESPVFAARGSAALPESVPPVSAVDSRDLLKRQQAVVAMGRRAAASPETSVLLQDAAELIAEMVEAEAFAVAELGAGEAELSLHLTLKQTAHASRRATHHALGASGEQSLAAYCLQVARPVVTDDLRAEGRFEDRLLSGFGFRSALAAPLKLQVRSFGALVACSAAPQQFTLQDAMFAETIGHLAATAVARSRAEKDLADERALSLTLLTTVGAIVLVLNGEGQAVRINRVCEQVTGYRLAELKDRPIWSVFATAAEAGQYRAMFDEVRRGKACVEREGVLLTKHAEPRRIRWSCTLMPNAKGSPETILATGIDVTEQYEARRRAEQAAERPRGAVVQTPPVPDSPTTEPPPASENSPPPSAPREVTSPLDPILRERRRRQRRAFPYPQSIAPILNGQLPPREQFRNVLCHDIGSGGFAYLADRPPESDSFVVALGKCPKLTYVIAQVVHVTRSSNSDGQLMYLVGCTYTGRAPY